LTIVLVAFVLSALTRRAGRRIWAKAYIVNTMGPLLAKHLTPHSSIRVVGADCRYLADKKKWRETLDSWLSKGCKVQYLISEPHSNAQKVLEELASTHPDSFEFRKILPIGDVQAGEDDKELLKDLLTFHFILGDGPKLMWIEGNHPQCHVEADDCEFVAPKRAERDERYREYSSIFERVWSNYTAQSRLQNRPVPAIA
jgi:hypothetical protein